MSNHAKSGLRTLERSFSSTLPSSQETVEYSWPGSSSHVNRTSFSEIQNTLPSTKSAKATDAGKAARWAAINAALEAKVTVDTSISGDSGKRKLPTEEEPGPAKRKRIIPWETDPSTSSTDFTSKPSKPSTASTSKPSTGPGKAASIFLSKEQKHILNLVKKGQSVFYTGSAGTGKSVLLREIIRSLKVLHSKSGGDAVAITASTGIAACNIGGMTIHSFAGVGLAVENVDDLVKKVRKNKKAMGRWQRTKVLVVDEVSMVDGDLFDKLARIAGIVRKSSKPFGGIQLIVTGDFFQLPPVARGEPTFAFEADMWAACIPTSFRLTKVFRQKDPAFVDMLNEMRYGKLSQESIARFKKLSRPVHYEDGMEPTELFPRRENVESSNNSRNANIRGETHVYHASDSGTISDVAVRDKLIANSMYPQKLELKVGSQVMLIKNTDESLVNGSCGKVVRFDSAKDWKDGVNTGADKEEKEKDTKKSAKIEMMYPVVAFGGEGSFGYERQVLVQPESWKSELPSGEVQAERKQLPLILSWAMSIHKSQGQTLQRVKVDLGRVFEKGQAYVALSRATSLDGLQVLNFDEKKVMVHPKVVAWSETLESIMDAA